MAKAKKIIGPLPTIPDNVYDEEVLVTVLTSLGQTLGAFICHESALDVFRACNSDREHPQYYAWNYEHDTTKLIFSEKIGQNFKGQPHAELNGD